MPLILRLMRLMRFMIERRLGEAGIALASPQQTFQLQAEGPLRVRMEEPGRESPST